MSVADEESMDCHSSVDQSFNDACSYQGDSVAEITPTSSKKKKVDTFPFTIIVIVTEVQIQMTRSQWCSTVCTTKHPSTSSICASLSPVSPPDNIFALPAEVFSSCLAIVSAVMVGGLFLWPDPRHGTDYQTVGELWSSAETPSSIH